MNTAFIQNKKKNSRLLLFFLLLLAALVFAATLGSALFRFAFPQPRWVELGPLDDFPPSDQPYVVDREVYVFLINDGESITVLNPLNSSRGGMIVAWDSKDRVFRDPLRGSEFDLHGMYILGPNDHNLARYNFKIEHEVVYMDLNHSQAELIDWQE